ncbi:hypothetical protein ALT_0669 [Aspergillus lentulus]|uniref:Uncharacterized protein n=1 Tax=Aspergillus lentulus TaxID=293939 RepID=A0AAN4T6X6_ASPLE|nr:hypothetical protein ALT_0669 [Aspergillus lentulus]
MSYRSPTVETHHSQTEQHYRRPVQIGQATRSNRRNGGGTALRLVSPLLTTTPSSQVGKFDRAHTNEEVLGPAPESGTIPVEEMDDYDDDESDYGSG